MALCSLKMHRFEAAYIYYKEALEIDPAHAPSLEGVALAAEGMRYAGGGGKPSATVS